MADDRLLDTSNLELERELLRAAAEECPPASARRRGLAALGLLTLAAPTAAAAAPVAGGIGAAAGTVGTLGWQAMVKVGVILGLGSAVVGGAIAVDRTVNQPQTPRPVAALVVALPRANVESSEATPAPTVDSAPRPGDRAVAEGEPAARPDRASNPPRRVEAKRAAATGAPSIRDEIELLDRARAALARGSTDAALATLSEYSSRHPGGELREEAAILRIEALRMQGNARAAGDAARRFGERFPSSPHQDRLHDASPR